MYVALDNLFENDCIYIIGNKIGSAPKFLLRRTE